jgi:hypothetical protein
MFKRIGLLCVAGSLSLIAMDQPGQRSKLTVEQAKAIVTKYVTEKEGSYVKNTNYYKEPLANPGVVALPPVAIDQEMKAALVDIFENTGYVCADNKVFRVIFDDESEQYKVKTFINLTGKVEQTDHSQPAIVSMRVARMQGAEGPRVLLGEINGRLLVADIEKHVINSFSTGEIKGKITEIVPHPEGTHLAVKYLQDTPEDSRKKNPCIAACRAFLALQSSQKRTGSYLAAENKARNRRSWLPQGYVWSPLVTKECVNGIDGIRWENNILLVQCSLSKKWESYRVENDALVEIESTLP